MRQRIEDLGRLSVMLRQMINLDFWNEMPYRPGATASREEADTFDIRYSNMMADLDRLFTMISDASDIADGEDRLNQMEDGR